MGRPALPQAQLAAAGYPPAPAADGRPPPGDDGGVHAGLLGAAQHVQQAQHGHTMRYTAEQIAELAAAHHAVPAGYAANLVGGSLGPEGPAPHAHGGGAGGLQGLDPSPLHHTGQYVAGGAHPGMQGGQLGPPPLQHAQQP